MCELKFFTLLLQLRNGVTKSEDETRLTSNVDVGVSRHRGDGATSSESPELSGLDVAMMDTSRPMSEASSVWDEAESQLEVKRRHNMLMKVKAHDNDALSSIKYILAKLHSTQHFLVPFLTRLY